MSCSMAITLYLYVVHKHLCPIACSLLPVDIIIAKYHFLV